MKIDFYLLSILVTFFSNQIIAQNCSTQELDNSSICLPDTYLFEGNSGKIAVYGIGDTSLIALDNTVIVSPTINTGYLYAQTDQVGPADQTIGAGDFYTTVDKYVSFKANHNLIINTIDVYPQNAGDITIRLVKMGGFLNLTENLIESRSVTVSSGGFQTINVSFYVPQGDNYRLMLTSETCGGLFRNSEGQAFPYTSPAGSLEITGGDYSFMGYYYYFYNWNFTPVACINTVEISVLSIPSATVSVNQNILAANEPGLAYQWINCATGQAVSGATSQQFIPSESGDYSVVVSNGACEETSGCVSYTVNTAGVDALNDDVFSMYPNPAEDNLFIQSETGINQVLIKNVQGQLVYESGYVPVINVSSFPAGIYFVAVKFNSDKTSMVRFIKK